MIQRFDRFFPYITNSLQKEAFIVESIKSVRKFALEKNTNASREHKNRNFFIVNYFSGDL